MALAVKDIANKLLHRASSMTWQAIYSAPRHGLGTETLPVSAIKPQIIGIPNEIQKLLVLRATGDNHPFLGLTIKYSSTSFPTLFLHFREMKDGRYSIKILKDLER